MYIEIKGIGLNNKGSELMLLAVIHEIRSRLPEARIVVAFDSPPRKIKELNLYRRLWKQKYKIQWAFMGNFIPKNVRASLGLVLDKEIDVILDASGFAYGDQWRPGDLTEMAGRTEDFKRAGKKIIFLPQAFGPFKKPGDKINITKLVTNANLICARDLTSLGFLRQIVGKQKNIFRFPDFTILLEGKKPDYFDPSKHQICIIPNSKMIDRTDSIVAKNYNEFLLYAFKSLEKMRTQTFILLHEQNKDSQIADYIGKMLDRKIEIVKEDDPILIKGILGNCQGVIGSRFHGLVGALSQGVPTIGTGWSHKYRELFKDYNCEECLIDLSSFNKKIINEKLSLIIDEAKRIDLQQRLRASTERQKELVREMWNMVFNIIQK